VKLPSAVADVLALVTRDPGRPRITWYGPDERIELSGAVLGNWVAKVTNLLVEEFDAGPGVRVELDLPAHWRTVVWALAVWRSGACVADDGTRVIVTDRAPDGARAAARDRGGRAGAGGPGGAGPQRVGGDRRG